MMGDHALMAWIKCLYDQILTVAKLINHCSVLSIAIRGLGRSTNFDLFAIMLL